MNCGLMSELNSSSTVHRRLHLTFSSTYMEMYLQKPLSAQPQFAWVIFVDDVFQNL